MGPQGGGRIINVSSSAGAADPDLPPARAAAAFSTALGDCGHRHLPVFEDSDEGKGRISGIGLVHTEAGMQR
jgi:hypothetical protein